MKILLLKSDGLCDAVSVTGTSGDVSVEVGPRHLHFLKPENKFVYSSNEQDNSVTCYGYDPASGTANRNLNAKKTK